MWYKYIHMRINVTLKPLSDHQPKVTLKLGFRVFPTRHLMNNGKNGFQVNNKNKRLLNCPYQKKGVVRGRLERPCTHKTLRVFPEFSYFLLASDFCFSITAF